MWALEVRFTTGLFLNHRVVMQDPQGLDSGLVQSFRQLNPCCSYRKTDTGYLAAALYNYRGWEEGQSVKMSLII